MKKKKILPIIIVVLLISGTIIYENVKKRYHYLTDTSVQLLNSEKENNKLINKIKENEKEIESLLKYFEGDNLQNLEFDYVEQEIKELGKHKIKIETFSNPFLGLLGKRASLELNNNNVFLITGNGDIFYSKNFDVRDNKIKSERIETNLKSLLNPDYLSWANAPFKDIIIKNSKVYVSLTNWRRNPILDKTYTEDVPFAHFKDNCFFAEVFVADYSTQKMEFKKFFTMKDCMPLFNNSVGTILEKFKDDEILLTVGDHGSCGKLASNYPQKDNHLAGKIIKINEKNGAFKILSKGHRNQQGIFYDSDENIIISTEHGPKGGDEININYLSEKSGEIKNYGWGSASYGEHYPTNEKYHAKVIAACPVKKSHSENNFIEPIKFFTPSIAITQVIKENQFIQENKDYYTIYFTSLGYTAKKGRRSFHKINLKKNDGQKLSLVDHEIVTIGNRIRDMIYIKEIKSFVLFMELTGSKKLGGTIAIISLVD